MGEYVIQAGLSWLTVDARCKSHHFQVAGQREYLVQSAALWWRDDFRLKFISAKKKKGRHVKKQEQNIRWQGIAL